MYSKWFVSVFVFASSIAALKADDKILQKLSSLNDDLPRFYTQAIDQFFLATNPVSIAKYVADIYIDNDLVTYQVMTKAQLYLYWKYRSSSKKNDQYLLDVGYFFYKIQNDVHYSKLAAATTANLLDAIDQLPSSVQYLYFRPYFCLLNNAYSEFIYTNTGRHIYTFRTPNKIGGDGYWIRTIKEKSKRIDSELKLQFQLISNQYRRPIYLERNDATVMNIIATWFDGATSPPTSFWTLQLIGNQLIFNQENGLRMCALTKTASNTERYVYGIAGAATNDAMCQWIAKGCP